MSLFDYRESLRLAAEDPPFYSLIMAAILKADTTNAARLRVMFPETWSELEKRYRAPGGMLPDELSEG